MVERKTVLMIEDEAEMRDIVRATLESAGCRVLEAEELAVGIHLFSTQKPDLVILDITLPDGNGLDACRRIRDHKTLAATPVIMLTGQSEMHKKLAGFTAGADQYLVKPVLPEELLAWVQALLRRLDYGCESKGLQVGDLLIDPESRLARFRDQPIADLTGKEFELLYYLVKRRPAVLSRKAILSELWRTITVDNVVDVHISNLRKKIPVELSDRIQNVPGKGFRFFA